MVMDNMRQTEISHSSFIIIGSVPLKRNFQMFSEPVMYPGPTYFQYNPQYPAFQGQQPPPGAYGPQPPPPGAYGPQPLPGAYSPQHPPGAYGPQPLPGAYGPQFPPGNYGIQPSSPSLAPTLTSGNFWKNYLSYQIYYDNTMYTIYLDYYSWFILFLIEEKKPLPSDNEEVKSTAIGFTNESAAPSNQNPPQAAAMQPQGPNPNYGFLNFYQDMRMYC